MSHVDQIRRRAVRGGAILIAARLGLQVFQWGTTLVVARLLLPEHYGLVAIAALFVDLASLLASAGFGAALVQQAQITRKLEGQAFTLSLLLAATVYGVIWIAAPHIAQHFDKPEFVTFLRFMALTLWLIPINTVCNALLERELRLGTQAAVMGIVIVLQGTIALGMAYAGYGVWALGVSVVSASTAQALANWYFSGWRPVMAWPSAEARGLTRFGAMLTTSSVLWFIYISSDTLAISILLGPALVGIYAIALQLVRMPVDKISISINSVAFAVYCRMTSEPDRLREWYLQLLSLVLCFVAPVLVGAALVANDVLPVVLGEHWRPIVVPFQILAPVGVSMIIATTLTPLLNALGRPDIPMKFTAVCTAIYPPAFLLATYWFGLVGACLVWLVLFPAQTVLMIHLSRGTTGVSVPLLLRKLTPVLAGLLMMAVSVTVVRYMTAHLPLAPRVALNVATGAFTYAGCVLQFGGWRMVETLLAMLRQLRSPAAEQGSAAG